MAKALQRRRGTTEEHKSFTGLEGELTIDTDKHSIRVHDGVTAGGHEILPKAKNDELYAPKGLDVGVTSVNGQTGDVTVDVGVTSVNGNTGEVTPEQTGCLPLSGGTMNGPIIFYKDLGLLRMEVDDKYISIFGSAAWGNGAVIELFGKDNSAAAGAFNLWANSGTNAYNLMGKPDGSLTWGGKSVVCVESWVNGDTGYRKYSDGYIEQWGRVTEDGTVTFPIAFATTNYNVTMSDFTQNDTWNSGCSSLTTTSMYIHKANNGGCMWRACGY